ncbi:MAG: hypothetical protein IID31_09450 [Planctomycetes bacterium]|nr:hypothetical protein [Planctomycetota bacterium]
MILDGQCWYQYDAWNRLVQVNEASRDPIAGIIVGSFVKGYAYDRLGRLVRTQSPYPQPGSTTEEVRTERSRPAVGGTAHEPNDI